MESLRQIDGPERVSIVKRFDEPERVLVFAYGRLEVLTVGGQVVGKGSYEPGWRWSQSASRTTPLRGALPPCVGAVLSGRTKVRLGQGVEVDLTPGDFFHATVSPAFDMWVVGYRPCEILYLSGVEALIRLLHGTGS